MPRAFTRASQIVIDLMVLAAALALAFFARFDGVPPAPMIGRLLLTGPYVVIGEYALLVAFGVHRFAWRYIGLRDVSRILMAVGASTLLLCVARLIAGELQTTYAYLRHGVIPFGVIAVNFPLVFLGIAGARVLRRVLGERHESVNRRRPEKPATRTILIGAGQAGVLVAKELASRPDLGMQPVGFLDDDRHKLGSIIHGIPVIGTTEQLAELTEQHSATQVLITIAAAPGSAVRRIRELGERAGVSVKIIPGLYEIVGGQVNLSRIRDIAIDDLLRRDPVELEHDVIEACVQDQVVLTTGAGGSIGSELCRQICMFRPKTLVLVERAENSLFHIHRELCAKHPELEVVPCIADVADERRMSAIFEQYRPAVVLHAAAHKHVPMMEWNAVEAIKNNVFGTKCVADLAGRFGVSVFVLISTDKAVNPTSVMGATKRAAEIYVQALGRRSDTRFVTVRFGNVLGSAGSVIPLFREQIAAGGPVTVTHPDMRRYFMTIPEACQLVLQAGSMGNGGEIFVLDMGDPVKIVDLAKDLIELSGLKLGEDIEIEYSGLRPGEKLFEELSTDSEQADKTRHPKIFVGRIVARQLPEVVRGLAALEDAVQSESTDNARLALAGMVPEFRTTHTPAPAADAKTEVVKTPRPIPALAH